jgi:hypothetical protein
MAGKCCVATRKLFLPIFSTVKIAALIMSVYLLMLSAMPCQCLLKEQQKLIKLNQVVLMI